MADGHPPLPDHFQQIEHRWFENLQTDPTSGVLQRYGVLVEKIIVFTVIALGPDQPIAADHVAVGSALPILRKSMMQQNCIGQWVPSHGHLAIL